MILEAQASGLPVVAVDAGGPASLIEHGETGLLAPPDAEALADAVLSLIEAPLLAERLRRAAPGRGTRAHLGSRAGAPRGRLPDAPCGRARTAQEPSGRVASLRGTDQTDAVIPVAGLGTRLLPATRSQPKEMLPVLDKPVVQYVVEELAQAGIERVLFVTGRRKRAIEDHFDVPRGRASKVLLQAPAAAGRARRCAGARREFRR